MVFREKFSKAKFRVRAEEPVTLFSLVGDEVIGRCSRNPVLSLKLPSPSWVGPWFLQENSDIGESVPGGGARTVPHPAAPLFLGWPLPCLHILSCPWLETVWGCPLELREGLGGWSLFPTNKRRGTRKGFCIPQGPAQFQYYGLSMWSWTSALEIEKDPPYRHPWIMLLNTCLCMLLMGNSLNGLYNLSSKPGHFELWKEVQLIVLQAAASTVPGAMGFMIAPGICKMSLGISLFCHLVW